MQESNGVAGGGPEVKRVQFRSRGKSIALCLDCSAQARQFVNSSVYLKEDGDEFKKKLIALFDKGISPKQIAAIFTTSPKKIGQYARKFGYVKSVKTSYVQQ